MSRKIEGIKDNCGNQVASNQLVIMHPLTIKMCKPCKWKPPFRLRVVRPNTDDEMELRLARAMARYRRRRKE